MEHKDTYTKNMFAAILCGALLLAALVACLSVPARADMTIGEGKLTVTVVNAPDEPYGLHLLELHEDGTYDPLPPRYDPKAYENAPSLEVADQWVFEYWTISPMTPGKTVRIAIATEDAVWATEKPCETRLVDEIIYDWETNTARRAHPVRDFMDDARPFLFTCTATLVIEGFVLLLFRLRRLRTWLVFLCTNVVTQIGLHAFCRIYLDVMDDTAVLSMVFFLFYVPIPILLVEAAVFVLEAGAYRLLWREDGARDKAVKYAAIANLASFLGGFVVIIAHGFLLDLCK